MPSTPRSKNLTINVAKSNTDGGNSNGPPTTQTPRTTMFFDDDVDVTAPPVETAAPRQEPKTASPSDSSTSSPAQVSTFTKPRSATQGQPPPPPAKGEHYLRHMPHTVSTNALPTVGNKHPYSRGNASAASLSHGNLLDTASVTSSGVGDSATIMSEDDRGSALKKTTTLGDGWSGGNKQRVPRQVFRSFLNRSPSVRQGDDPPAIANAKPRLKTSRKHLHPDSKHNDGNDPKTAPIDPERGFRDMMSSRIRNKSADRVIESEEEGVASKPSTLSKDGAEFWANIKQGSSRAADGLTRTGKGLFSKFRSGSDTGRDHSVDDNYTLKVINLPLIPQVRKTRLRSRMEDARDKTEFWMPSLPYRCVDFLNLKGVEEEGIYRIPGSGRDIKHWQSRFDRELDVNLLDEESLYDINIVASMLKAWLRELPDELFPKTTQSKIANACQGATDTPQMLKDELSKLPPFNYYTLFAITCHISVLHNHSEKNKMSYQNLCICFQPCLKVDGFCFQFLVLDWKNCWTQGCWTEKEYLGKEYAILREAQQQGGPPPSSSSSLSKTQSAAAVTNAYSKGTKGHGASSSGTVAASDLEQAVTSGSEPSSRAPSRPTTGRKNVPSTVKSYPASSTTNKSTEHSTPSVPQSPRDANGRTVTPPSLDPVASFSPMRM